MTGEVHKLKQRDESVRDAPAIGMSVVMNMPGDRQATLQCFVAQEDGEQAANDLLDRMFRIADRQRARYELHDLEREISEHRRILANHDGDLARLEKEFATKKVEKEEEYAALLEEAQTETTEGYDEHVKSGRQGQFVPAGARKQRIEAKRSAASKAKLDIEKMDAERTAALDQVRVAQRRFRGEIEWREKAAAKCRALLGIADGA